MVNHEEYYRGRWWLPLSLGCDETCELVYACGLSVHQKCSNHALTNLLFGLCRLMWIIDPPIICPSPHPITLTRPITFKMLRTREHTPIPFSSDVFTNFELAFESFKECGGASKNITNLLNISKIKKISKTFWVHVVSFHLSFENIYF
jgi:hypothetical protein